MDRSKPTQRRNRSQAPARVPRAVDFPGSLRAQLNEQYESLVFVDGCDAAIIGVGERCGQKPVVIYDRELVLRELCHANGWGIDEATEFFEFNVAGAWVGDQTPMFLERP